MPNELELCTVAAVIGALLGGGVAYVITHKLDGAHLAQVQKANADTLARINATAAAQLADALKRGQAAEGQVATLEQQYNDEVAQHAKDNLDYRAKLLAGTATVRVRIKPAACSGASAAGQSATPATGIDDAAAYADLSPATAASAVAVTDSADNVASQLRGLQAYVKELQDAGYITK